MVISFAATHRLSEATIATVMKPEYAEKPLYFSTHMEYKESVWLRIITLSLLYVKIKVQNKGEHSDV
jgi:hypothetical protein